MTKTLERQKWIILLSTGDPRLTYTEYAYSLSGVRDIIDYYGMDRLLIFGEGYNKID